MYVNFLDHTSILGQNWGLSNSEKLHSEIRDFHISLSGLLFLDKLICDMSSLKMICLFFFPHTSLFHGPQLLCSLPTTALNVSESLAYITHFGFLFLTVVCCFEAETALRLIMYVPKIGLQL